MHSLLEDYLSEVATHLSALPAKQRNEELREMRVHLENAVFVSREGGQSEEEAVQNAVAQFGTPRNLGENIVWSWRRGLAQDRRSFWGAAACTSAALVLAPYLFITFIIRPLEPIGSVDQADWAVVKWLLFGSNLAYPIVAGLTSGVFFSKRAIAGTALGAIGYLMLCIDASCHMNHFWHRFEEVRSFLWFMGESLAALCVAWASSRWQQKRGRRIWA